jgi:hypothetical protein
VDQLFALGNVPVLWRKRHKTNDGGAAIFSGCPEPTLKPSRQFFTLSQLHAELAGKFLERTAVKASG